VPLFARWVDAAAGDAVDVAEPADAATNVPPTNVPLTKPTVAMTTTRLERPMRVADPLSRVSGVRRCVCARRVGNGLCLSPMVPPSEKVARKSAPTYWSLDAFRAGRFRLEPGLYASLRQMTSRKLIEAGGLTRRFRRAWRRPGRVTGFLVTSSRRLSYHVSPRDAGRLSVVIARATPQLSPTARATSAASVRSAVASSA
jgi:hypothetical protein